MTSKLKVNLINDAGDNNLITSNGSGSVTLGTAFPPVGKVGQVISNSAAINTTISSTSLVEMDSNVRITITPSAATSKVLYMLSFPFLSQANQTGFFINIYKSVGGASYADDSGELSRYTGYGSNDDKYETATFHYLSSPSTTSAVIYTPYVKVNANNINYGNTAKFNVTVQEILA